MAETSTIFGFMKYVSATDILSDFKKTVDSHFVNSLNLINLIRLSKDTCRLLKKPIPFYKGIGFLFCLDRRSEIISNGKTLT